MERTLTPEERIRKAEEIYNRRKYQGVRVPSSTVNKSSKPSLKMFKKIIIQLIICSLIYYIFYLIQTTNYVFSEDVIKKTKEVLSYDINFTEIYNQFFNKSNNTEQEIVPPEEEVVNEDTTNTLEGIGGGQSYVPLDETLATENTKELEEDLSNLSQMELDAREVKKNYSFIKPVEGVVSSRFGARESSSSIVSSNHEGIDIAASSGTVIYAAMAGTVTMVSSESGYGNHFKIVNGDVTTLYAHCKTIYVQQGDEVEQGQAIAEVGSTGNSTGPHLHFEIRLEDRFINPEYVLEF